MCKADYFTHVAFLSPLNRKYQLGENLSQAQSTNITRDMCDVFSRAARITLGLKYNNNKSSSSDNVYTINKKPWFNGGCRAARKNFHLA